MGAACAGPPLEWRSQDQEKARGLEHAGTVAGCARHSSKSWGDSHRPWPCLPHPGVTDPRVQTDAERRPALELGPAPSPCCSGTRKRWQGTLGFMLLSGAGRTQIWAIISKAGRNRLGSLLSSGKFIPIIFKRFCTQH